MSAAWEGGKEKGAATPAPGGACELCGAMARVYCGADEATLCWGCDAQVHGANFLVARHARALLCRGCARPTSWRAAGPRLGPSASLCDRCVRRGSGAVGVGGDVEMGGTGDGRGDEEEEEDDDEEDDDVVVEDDDDEEEGEGENQVVPWTEEAEATPPPVASSTSSSSREAPANGASGGECAKVRPLLPFSLHLLLDLPFCRSICHSIALQRCNFFIVDRAAFPAFVNRGPYDRPFPPIRERPVVLIQMSPRFFQENMPCSTSQTGLLCHNSSSARHGGRSDEVTSSRNGGRFLASGHRKRSPSDFFGSASAQSGSGPPAMNGSNAGIGRNE
jgi:hypothetical protein